KSRPVMRRGVRLTRWELTPELVAPPAEGAGYDSRAYFYFSTRLVYGGNWARLSAAQRALYLAVGSKAMTYAVPPRDIEMLKSFPNDWFADLEECFRQTDDNWVRLGCVSVAELSDISGVSRSALQS